MSFLFGLLGWCQVLENMRNVVQAAGCEMSDVLKTTILLRDMADFQKVNAIYETFFPSNPPARATFAVAGLPKDARVEIEAIVHVRQ
jgi:2-iminobutanoate/2-iminopropanoate deaminase